jgi:hypothetical protein
MSAAATFKKHFQKYKETSNAQSVYHYYRARDARYGMTCKEMTECKELLKEFKQIKFI